MPALTPDRLDEFMALAFTRPPTADRRASLMERLQDPDFASRRRYVAGADGSIVSATWLSRDTTHTYTLVPPRSAGPIDPHGAIVIEEAVAVAKQLGAHKVALRMPELQCTEAVVAACARSGAAPGPGRVEFEALLADLPLPAPTDSERLSFVPAPDEATAAAVLARTAVASPNGLEPGETAEAVIRQILSRPHRTTRLPDVLHLGRRPGVSEPIAMVCAQIDPDDGWSTITYLSLDPQVRGQGLGSVVHRHGLAMLRAQGGRLYRGGTSLTNLPMRGCFARQGVPEVARYREFTWTFSPVPPHGSS
ncbi:MAG: GNAT family N-acetyltransferase [Myxococcota bacterium]